MLSETSEVSSHIAAIVHPNQKVGFPLAPEPIMNTDGKDKNDCERNAFKRWLKDFRREHPHLNAVIIADGLASNGPFVRELRDHKCKFILVCRDSDHRYLGLQRFNKLFQEAYAKCGAKYSLWEEMRGVLGHFILPSFEVLYDAIAQPPPPVDLSHRAA